MRQSTGPVPPVGTSARTSSGFARALYMSKWIDLESAMRWECEAQIEWLASRISTATYLAARRLVQNAAADFLASIDRERAAFGQAQGICGKCNDGAIIEGDTLCENCAQDRDEAEVLAAAEDEAHHALMLGGR